eukprot:scaffold31082_cov61-Phaeocystis_antarctica.AAC.2
MGLTSQDRRAGGTHRLGGDSQSPSKTFMHLTLWPKGEEQRYTIDGRALSPEGGPTHPSHCHPSYPQSLCESQHPLQRRRGWVAGPRRIAAQVASIGIGEEMSQSPRPPSDSLWPEGEEQRYTIDGRALVKRRRALASGIEGEGAPEGDPTRSGLG